MKTIEEAKRLLKSCNLVHHIEIAFLDNKISSGKDFLFHGWANEICPGDCVGCRVEATLEWIFPELKGYDEVMSFDEWLKWANENLKEEDKLFLTNRWGINWGELKQVL